MSRPRSAFHLLLAIALAAAGCDHAPPAGPPSTAAPAGPRIVALAPGIRQTLDDLGGGRLIVGRHAYDAWADPATPACGDQAGIDYEALVRVNPTHVLLQWRGDQRGAAPGRLLDLARAHHWTVRNYPLLSLEEVVQAAEDMERLLPADQPQSASPHPPSAAARLRQALARRPGVRPDAIGPVLLLYGVSPPTALGPGSYHHQMLQALGARPALSTGQPYMVLDVEDVLRLAPGAIVLVQPRWGADEPSTALAGAQPLARLGRLATLPIPAVELGRVALIDDPKALLPGTNLADVADDLAAILEAWSTPAAR